MQPVYRCIQCRTSLSYQLHQQKIWYRCQKCLAGFIPVDFMSAILSEFEFNKFRYSLQKAQIKSLRKCPCCQSLMTKLMDVVRTNQLEACASCQLVWLHPDQGFKIKNDQLGEKTRERKVSLRESDVDLELIFGISSARPPVKMDSVLRHEDQELNLFSRLINKTLRFLGIENLSQKFPTLAFILMMTLFILVLKLLFSAVSSVGVHHP